MTKRLSRTQSCSWHFGEEKNLAFLTIIKPRFFSSWYSHDIDSTVVAVIIRQTGLFRVWSSGVLCHVILQVDASVSEGLAAPLFRVEVTLQLDKTTQCYDVGDHSVNSHCWENFSCI
jgi:hypothetical protein